VIFSAGDQSVYELSKSFGKSNVYVWLALFAVWVAAVKWREPTTADGEDQYRLQELGRKRSRRLAACLIAIAVLWPIFGILFVYFTA
jgi:hypothetical protein